MSRPKHKHRKKGKRRKGSRKNYRIKGRKLGIQVSRKTPYLTTIGGSR